MPKNDYHLAGQLKKLRAALVDVIDIAHARLDTRHYLKQPTLSFEQWKPAQVFTVDLERIERAKERRAAIEHQRVKVRSAIGIKTDDLAVQDRGVTSDRSRDLTLERFPSAELVAVAGDETALFPLDVRERAEAVKLQFVDEIRMVELVRHAQQWLGGEHVSIMSRRWGTPRVCNPYYALRDLNALIRRCLFPWGREQATALDRLGLIELTD